MDAGRPVQANDALSTRELSGIIEYIPGDLTLTARAGTTLGEIRDAVAANGQFLALDPYGSNDGTIGATIATGSAGPFQTHFGRARDLVLGIEYVTGAGVIARGGGRVVKNVAGFDVTRLLTGSWGTLGVITEVTVRLHATPPAEECIAVPLGGDIGAVRGALRAMPFIPYSCEILNDDLVDRLTGSRGVTGLVRIGGNAEAVHAQRNAFAALGEIRSVDPTVWDLLRGVEPAGAIVFRLSRHAAEIDRVWAEANTIAAAVPGTLLHANPLRGVVRCIVPASEAAERAVEAYFRSWSDTVLVGERLTPTLWTHCPTFADSAGLAANIKRTFDPNCILNPGILAPIA